MSILFVQCQDNDETGDSIFLSMLVVGRHMTDDHSIPENLAVPGMNFRILKGQFFRAIYVTN